MFKGLLTASLSVLLLASGAAADNTLPGYSGTPAGAPEMRPETMFQGDLLAEMGLGCSNGVGTSGGPNDCLVGVAAPPFGIIVGHYYEIFTQVSPTITALSFIVHTGMAMPGAEIGRVGGLDWSQGPHTSYIIGINVPTTFLFFGQNQPQSNVGMRWGLDTSSSAGTSYIRAPACGADAFTLVDALGFPGNWCYSVEVAGHTPIELQTWGSLKTAFR